MPLAVWAAIVSRTEGCARALNPFARVFKKMRPAAPAMTGSAIAPARNQMKLRIGSCLSLPFTSAQTPRTLDSSNILFRAWGVRFNMDDHISNPIELFPDQEPSSGGEVARILNRHLGVYFAMKFDLVLQPR